MDDLELLRLYAFEGQQSAFTEIVRRHLGWVQAAALRRCGGRSDLADEVVQRVFIILAMDARRLARHTNLGGWLFVAVRYTAGNALRAEMRRRAHENAAGQLTAQSIMSDGTPDWEQLRPVIDAALDRLAQADRDALIRRYFMGAAFASDAERKRVVRALAKLRVMLGRMGIASTAGALSGALAKAAVPASEMLPQAVAISGKALAAVTTAAHAAGSAFPATVFHSLFRTTMTMSQKFAIAAALASAIFGTWYEYSAYTAGQLRIGRLKREVATLASRVDQPAIAPSQAPAPMPPPAAGTNSAAANPEEEAMRSAIAKMRARLATDPRQSIPELAYLSAEDWILAVQRAGQMVTEDDLRRGLGYLRTAAIETFEKGFRPAWANYLKASGGEAPPNLAVLGDFFDPPLSDVSVLGHYQVLPWPSDDLVPQKPGEVRIGIAPKTAIDPDFDQMPFIDVGSDRTRTYGNYGSVTFYGIRDPYNAALAAYSQANPQRTSPPSPAELVPFFKNPTDAERFLNLPR